MKEKSFIVECRYCDIEVEIHCETDMFVEYCPFCGEELAEEMEDELEDYDE